MQAVLHGWVDKFTGALYGTGGTQAAAGGTQAAAEGTQGEGGAEGAEGAKGAVGTQSEGEWRCRFGAHCSCAERVGCGEVR